jgi:hypothetical protein
MRLVNPLGEAIEKEEELQLLPERLLLALEFARAPVDGQPAHLAVLDGLDGCKSMREKAADAGYDARHGGLVYLLGSCLAQIGRLSTAAGRASADVTSMQYRDICHLEDFKYSVEHIKCAPA